MKKTSAIVIIALWAVIIGIGTIWITDFSAKPGDSGNSPASLPVGFSADKQAKLPRLLLFLHPQCPCSRATVAELNRLVSRNMGMMEIDIFFYQPADQPREWVETDIWRQAGEIPNTKLAPIGEDELKKFGALTSGQVLLYDADARLVFSGGITRMRGHEGDNLGSQLIEEHLRGELTTFSETPVFGCILTTLDQPQ